MNTKFSGLILAGLAAFAWYKYSKMSPEQRKNLVNNVKEKGKKIYDQYMPAKARETVETI